MGGFHLRPGPFISSNLPSLKTTDLSACSTWYIPAPTHSNTKTPKIKGILLMLKPPPSEEPPEDPPPKIESTFSLTFLITSSISGGVSFLPQGSLLSFPFQDIYIASCICFLLIKVKPSTSNNFMRSF